MATFISAAVDSNTHTTVTASGTSDPGAVITRVMDAFVVVAWYNSLEVLVLASFVFKRFKGLYFWSVVVCAVGIPFYATGWWLPQNIEISGVGSTAFVSIGAWLMIPSQPLVLWSRLHLVTQNRVLLRSLLILIIAETICLMVPNCVLSWYGLLHHNRNYESQSSGFIALQKVQVCVYAAQELAISLVYMYEVRGFMQSLGERRSMRIMKQLIAMNIGITVLNVLLVAVEFCSWYKVEPTLKALVYSIKLKVEFGVLTKLVGVVRSKKARKRVGFDGKTLSTQGRPSVPANPPNVVQDDEKGLDSTQTTPMPTNRGFGSLFQSFNSGHGTHPSFWDNIGTSSTEESSKMQNLQFFDQQIRPATPRQPDNVNDNKSRYIHSLQQNVPSEWRLSIGHEALSGPNLLERSEEMHIRDVEGSSLESVGDLYPGQLGGEVR